jgi:AraC-like DNA-binding protein
VVRATISFVCALAFAEVPAAVVGSDVNLSALAQRLGYFDQAHFTRDFKRVTGVSPGRY